MIQLLSIFRNLKQLDITRYYPDQSKITYTVSLPNLENLQVINSRSFLIFTGLNSLKDIQIQEWIEIIDLQGIFDPSKIMNFTIHKNTNIDEVLRIFTNLRSLRINNEY